MSDRCALLDHATDRPVEALAVRSPVREQPIERLTSIEHRQKTCSAGCFDVEAFVDEVLEKSPPMRLGGNHQRRVSPAQPDANEARNYLAEELVLFIELDDVTGLGRFGGK